MFKIFKQAEDTALTRALRKIRNDRVAFIAAIVLGLLYLSVALAGFIAPYGEHWNARDLANAPPTPVYMVDEEGSLRWPFVYRYERTFNPATFTFDYLPVVDDKYPVRFFVKGDDYKLMGVIPGDVHMFGVEAPGVISLFGMDMNGRDIFSRMLYGGQISLTIGFLSLLIAFPIGMLYGGISGYFGGRVDNLMMRGAEIIMSIPSLYLLITLAAILPPGLPSRTRFAMVVAILAFIGWAGLARVIRGMVLSIKQQEFVEAGHAIGLRHVPIIVKHILPQTASYVLVAITLGVPGYILAESGLSFLGLGILPPDASWGNMLKEAQQVTNLIYRPLMLMPGFMIFLAVLSFNVLGDAVRDILDPKSYLRR